MKKLILFIFLFATSCVAPPTETNEDPCLTTNKLHAPPGYSINQISSIDLDGYLFGFQFLNEQLGYALFDDWSYPQILKTKDGGQTWENLNMEILDRPQGFLFLDENNGVLSSYNNENGCRIYLTNDGGQNWTLHEFEELDGYFVKIISDQEGNLYGKLSNFGMNYLYKSEDNGKSGYPIFNDEHPELKISFSFFKSIEGIIYFTSEQGEIIGINSDGNIEERIHTFTNQISDLAIIDQENIIINDILSLKATNNGGTTWYTIEGNRSKIIDFDNQMNGVVITNSTACPSAFGGIIVNGHFRSSVSGGQDWNEITGLTTNLYSAFRGGQKVAEGKYYMFVDLTFYSLNKD